MGFVYILLGFVGGILGGMGMGGGTVLIPLLTGVIGICQKQAQFLNVVSFIIMALFIVAFYLKSGLINIFPAIIFASVGAVASFFSAMFVKDLPENILKIIFGIFLLVIAGIQIFVLFKNKSNKKGY